MVFSPQFCLLRGPRCWVFPSPPGTVHLLDPALPCLAFWSCASLQHLLLWWCWSAAWPGTGVHFCTMLWKVCRALTVHAHVPHSEPGFLHTHVVARELARSWHWQQPPEQPGGSRNPGSKGRRLLWLQPELACLKLAQDFPTRPWLARSLKAFLSVESDTGWWQPVINKDTNPPYATRGCLTALLGSCSTTRHVTTNQLGPIMKASLMLASTCLFALLGRSWRDEWLLCSRRAGSWAGGECVVCGWSTASTSSMGCLCSGMCLLGTDEPQCPARSVACAPRCRMRGHPPPGLQLHLHPHPQLLPLPCCCGSTDVCPVPPQLLTTGRKRGGRERSEGLLLKAASWIFSHYMKISRVCK